MDIEKLVHKGRLFAILLRSNKKIRGVEFYTEKQHTFQFGAQEREAGSVIQSHAHRPVRRVIDTTSEMIHLDYGKMEVLLYDKENNFVTSLVMNGGDTILFLEGGHGFRFLEKSKIIEVKQGPYEGPDEDKEKFVDSNLS